MKVIEIISHIMELPWYKVIYIALIDDIIVIFKLWWFWLSLGIIGAIIILITELSRP